ncbi:MAG: ABC transporter ATP-binding protein [Chloroflexi bacterium]|nr:ABC transporter ATP-binding protein [Chloroflexota bacterium]
MIRIENLTKIYDGSVSPAVSGLTLTIDRGDAFGFIGPNGAGKTTTMNILATLLNPTSGRAEIGGFDVSAHPEEVRALIGFVPEESGFYENLPVCEYLDFFAGICRKDAGGRRRLVERSLELTGMEDLRDHYINTLSGGYRQRVSLARALLHDPPVLLLDEPAGRLDARARIELRTLLKNLVNAGKTLFISSHILSELSDLCNKVGIIDRGRLLASGKPGDLMRNLHMLNRVKVRILGGMDRFEKILADDPLAGKPEKDQAGILRFDYRGDATTLNALLENLIRNKVALAGFWEERAGLEELFLEITRPEEADGK